jgi:hypothetical protein
LYITVYNRIHDRGKPFYIMISIIFWRNTAIGKMREAEIFWRKIKYTPHPANTMAFAIPPSL